MILMAVDPSGNFKYDKGNTGIVSVDIETKKIIYLTTIKATLYSTVQEYYNSILHAILSNKPNYVVIEDFKLQLGKSFFQSNKPAETNELIAFLEVHLDTHGIKHKRQSNVIKSRWKEDILRLELDAIFNYNLDNAKTPHEKDALKHLINIYMKTFNYFK